MGDWRSTGVPFTEFVTCGFPLRRTFMEDEMSDGIPEWLAVVIAVLMYCFGFLSCGAIIGRTPFWDGVRAAWTFGAKRPTR